MSDEEIRLRDAQLKDLGEELSSLISSFDKSNNKSQDIKDVESKTKEYQNALDSFKMEMRQLPPKDKSAYKQKAKEYRKKQKSFQEGLENMKSNLNRADLFEDHNNGSGEVDYDTNEGLIIHGRKLQEENKESLARTLAKVNESKQIGADIAVKLDNQTKQLEQMDEDLEDIKDTLARASKTIKRMARGVASDKIIWILAFLVFIAVVAVIIYKIVDPNANVNGVPTEGIDKLH